MYLGALAREHTAYRQAEDCSQGGAHSRARLALLAPNKPYTDPCSPLHVCPWTPLLDSQLLLLLVAVQVLLPFRVQLGAPLQQPPSHTWGSQGLPRPHLLNVHFHTPTRGDSPSERH